MFFKNLLIYRVTLQEALTPEVLENALNEKRALPCASQVPSTYGFAAPVGKGPDAPLVHAAQGFMLISARKEERILPPSVIKDALDEKVEEVEAAEARKVYRKEKEQFKDEILQALMPRAFIKKSTTFAAIDSTTGYIYVNASSPTKAEELLSAVREALGSLPVRPVNVKLAPAVSYTSWVRNALAGEGFYLQDECELKDSASDGAVIKVKREDLGSEEIQNLINAGKQVTRLSLAWQEKLSFVIDESLVVKRLRFDDLLQTQAEQDSGDDAASQFDATFVLMMLTLKEFVPALLEALGGEQIPDPV